MDKIAPKTSEKMKRIEDCCGIKIARSIFNAHSFVANLHTNAPIAKRHMTVG